MSPTELRKELKGVAFRTLLALFLIPGITYALAHYFKQDTDGQYKAAIVADIQGAAALSQEQRQAELAFFDRVEASDSCAAAPGDARMDALRQLSCARWSPLWQFTLVEKLAFWTLVGGGLLLALMVGLGYLAFQRREVQYASFVFGWRVLVIASASEMALQGLFAVWLSYWVTAFFLHAYIIKLVLIVGFIAVVAIGRAIISVFRRAQMDNRVQGELVNPAAAPQLWARIRELAARVDTAPPEQVIAGIDANFFVTEHPLELGRDRTRGRSLFISIPLLRVLDQQEADAVLAHELGHFAGGDTASSMRLNPKLAQFDLYTEQMRTGGATLLAFFLLILYRFIFELALQKSSREREFAADAVAARLTSPQALSRALVKISAYSSYRNQVESALFEQQQKHDGRLSIPERVAGGLAAFSQSDGFLQAVDASLVPHPFDSHPPMRDRMRQAGHEIARDDYAAIVAETPASTWVESINHAAQIEERLWQEFEQHFSQAHEESLAYRYLPANEQERELVLRYFPDIRFDTSSHQYLGITYAGLCPPGEPGQLLSWDKVANMRYEDATVGADVLIIEHPEKGLIGKKTTKIKLAIPSRERDAVKQALGKYWQRHQVMRAQPAS